MYMDRDKFVRALTDKDGHFVLNVDDDAADAQPIDLVKLMTVFYVLYFMQSLGLTSVTVYHDGDDYLELVELVQCASVMHSVYKGRYSPDYDDDDEVPLDWEYLREVLNRYSRTRQSLVGDGTEAETRDFIKFAKAMHYVYVLHYTPIDDTVSDQGDDDDDYDYDHGYDSEKDGSCCSLDRLPHRRVSGPASQSPSSSLSPSEVTDGGIDSENSSDNDDEDDDTDGEDLDGDLEDEVEAEPIDLSEFARVMHGLYLQRDGLMDAEDDDAEAESVDLSDFARVMHGFYLQRYSPVDKEDYQPAEVGTPRLNQCRGRTEDSSQPLSVGVQDPAPELHAEGPLPWKRVTFYPVDLVRGLPCVTITEYYDGSEECNYDDPHGFSLWPFTLNPERPIGMVNIDMRSCHW